MGSCQSAASGSAPLSINQAGVQDIKRNIESRFETHRNTSTKKVFGKQNIKITQGKGFDYNSPLLFSSTYKRFGPIVLEGPCNNYGCAYDVQQMSDVEISSFNKTIVGESENIWNDIISKWNKMKRELINNPAFKRSRYSKGEYHQIHLYINQEYLNVLLSEFIGKNKIKGIFVINCIQKHIYME